MSDQITPAPQAHPTATPTPQIAVHPPQSNFSRPTTASAAQNPTANPTSSPTANPTTPSTAPGATAPSTTTPAAPTEDEHLSFNNKLNNADRYWKFKSVIQVNAIIVGLIGIGTIGWIVSTTPMNDTINYGFEQYWTLWPSLITFAVSIVWCAACILVLILRKKPVTPGLRVAMDLLLWLAFIVTALFALVALMEIDQWGQYGSLDGYDYGYYSSSSGDYNLLSNGTWVWENSRNTGSTTYSDNRSCNRSSSSSSYYYGNTFKNCAEQDAYVNKLWQEKPHREAVEMTGVVCQFFSLVLHLVLFVWACVDCHRYRRSKVSKDAEKLAADIVQTMITSGAVVPPPGQAHMRPGAPWGQQQMGYYQLPQNGQGYPMQAMYPPQGQHMPQQYPQQYHPQQGMVPPPMTGAAGPSSEKTEGPRYA
jgi:hypothetical protein